MLAEAKAALAAAKKHKPKNDLEEQNVVLIRSLLTDVVTRLELLPGMLESHAKASAVVDAERALDAARDAQRG